MMFWTMVLVMQMLAVQLCTAQKQLKPESHASHSWLSRLKQGFILLQVMQISPSKQGFERGQVSISGCSNLISCCTVEYQSTVLSPQTIRFVALRLVMYLPSTILLHSLNLEMNLVPEGQLSQERVSKLNTFGSLQAMHLLPLKKGAFLGHVRIFESLSGGVLMQLNPLLLRLKPIPYSPPTFPLSWFVACSSSSVRFPQLQLCPQGLQCCPTGQVVQMQSPTLQMGFCKGQLMHSMPVLVKGLSAGHLVRLVLEERLNIRYLQSAIEMEPQIHLVFSRSEMYLLSFMLIKPVGSSGRNCLGGR